MTPQDLYAAVKPLWDRDAGFRPPKMGFGIPISMVLRIEDANAFTLDRWPVDVDTAAALMRDRIVERLGELAIATTFTKMSDVDEWRVDLMNWGPTRKQRETREYHQDRTLCLIAAAMKATEPATPSSPPAP